MSVFHKARNLNAMKPTGHEKWIPCNQFHRIDDKIPTVNGEIHQVQNPDLIGRLCDCRKCFMIEQVCSCPSVETRKWEIKWLPNPNY